MRLIPIVENEYYHVFNRGNNKQEIFREESDFTRFLFLILFFQSPKTFINIGRKVSSFKKTSSFKIGDDDIEDIVSHRMVTLLSFALMPNHFHLLVYSTQEQGVSKYMQRIMTSYTKYYNAKYNTVGHVFQGPYKAVHQKTEEQLFYTSAYIHSNPTELPEWNGREDLYPWSSYTDYIHKNRWCDLLVFDDILNQKNDPLAYKEYVKNLKIKDL